MGQICELYNTSHGARLDTFQGFDEPDKQHISLPPRQLKEYYEIVDEVHHLSGFIIFADLFTDMLIFFTEMHF